MTGKDLFLSLSYIHERYIEEAETRAFPRRNWAKVAALAACVCLVLFTLHSLRTPTVPEGNIPQDAETQPAGVEGMGAEACPGERPGSDTLSIILCIREKTDAGWTATVWNAADSGIFTAGMELKVVLADSIRPEEPDLAGCYVLVQIADYDRETGTILVEQIRVVQP